MEKKKNKQLKTKIVDSSKNILKKSVYTTSVLAVASMGVMNAANAGDLGTGITDDDNINTAYIFNTANKILTLTTDVSNGVYTTQTGAIADGANQAKINVLTTANDTTALTLTIASLILSNGGTAGVTTIKDVDSATGGLNVIVTGAYASEGTMIVQTLEAINDETITVTASGAYTSTGIVTLDADASGVTGSINVDLKAAGTFTNGIVMAGGTNAGDGSAGLTVSGGAAQTIIGTIDSLISDFVGDLTVTNTAGLVTFASAIGGTKDLKAITVGGSTFDSDVKFSGAVSSQLITVVGGDVATGAEDSEINFIAAVVAPTITLTSGNVATNVATVLFSASATTTALTGAITASTTSGTGTEVAVVDSADGAVTVQSFTGAIGSATHRIGTVSIGNADRAGSAAVAGDIFATDLTILSAAGTNEDSVLAASANLNATTITLDDNATGLSVLNLAATANKTLTGTINGGAVNEGTLQITGATKTIAGNVGVTLDLLSVDIDNTAIFNSEVRAKGFNIATGKTATFKGDIVAGSVKLVNIGTLALAGTTAQTITGVIHGAANTGAVTISNAAGATFVNEVGGAVASSVEIQTLTTTGTGRVKLSADLNIVNEVVLGDGTFLEVAKTITNGQELFTTAAAFDQNSVHAGSNILLPINMVVGNTLVFADGMTTADKTLIVADMNSALSDNAIIDYVASFANTDETIVTAVAKADTVVATELGTTTNEARALLQIQNALVGTASEEDILANALRGEGGLGSTADTAIAQQAAPQSEMTSGSTVSSNAMTSSVQGIVSNRMATLRSGEAYISGVSAGDVLNANSAFIQAFGTSAMQDNVKKGTGTVYGYDTETTGVAFGFDGMTENGSTIGLSASISTTEVDGKGTGKANNDIDSYTVSLYADKSTETGYIEGSLTYGINDNSTHRIVSAAGLTKRAYTAEYNSNQLSLKVSAGTPNLVADDTFVTPFGSFTGTLISTESYTEKSTVASDNLRLKVAQDDVASMVGSLGIKAHKVTDSGTPMISLALNNEFGDTEINSTNTYQGGGTAFKTSTDVEALSATLGLGYSFGNDMTSLNIGYEGEMDDNEYVSHYGSLKIVSKF